MSFIVLILILIIMLSYISVYHVVIAYIVIVIDYLGVGPGSTPGDWVVVPGMYGTHLKYRQHLQPISFNNLGLRLTRVLSLIHI